MTGGYFLLSLLYTEIENTLERSLNLILMTLLLKLSNKMRCVTKASFIIAFVCCIGNKKNRKTRGQEVVKRN